MAAAKDLKPVIGQSDPIDMSKGYDPSTLAGKVVLITGGANGLGASMVRAWASHGAHVFIGDVDDAAGEAFVAELRTAHPSQTFHYQHCDVTDWDEQVALFETAARLSPARRDGSRGGRAAAAADAAGEGGEVDVVVPNAGIINAGESYRFENPRPDPATGRIRRPDTRTLEVNIVGVTYTTHLALHYLTPGRDGESDGGRRRKRRDKCLLLIGSVASICPFSGQTHYTMSKHAVAGLFRTLRATASLRGDDKRLRVNMLAPYYVAGSRMLPAVAEAAFLSGGAGAATVPDVIDAATRLVADEAIAGRALLVGPRLRNGVPGEVPVGEDEGEGRGRAAWECYAGDYDEVETFTYRYVRVLAAAARLRGSLAWIGDVWNMLFRR
ncbi:short-chain dehydrogenase [Purpureocillium lavendulum]|uniref:Short-chain dehydrogenase n=1 Tax=Purpureocillium lavendulum TaxID=1247861 RepID=A0AB34FYF6_9HYPO|nr:short-chain dehydrogenase [Purpureocillium lavendulum]